MNREQTTDRRQSYTRSIAEQVDLSQLLSGRCSIPNKRIPSSKHEVIKTCDIIHTEVCFLHATCNRVLQTAHFLRFHCSTMKDVSRVRKHSTNINFISGRSRNQSYAVMYSSMTFLSYGMDWLTRSFYCNFLAVLWTVEHI